MFADTKGVLPWISMMRLACFISFSLIEEAASPLGVNGSPYRKGGCEDIATLIEGFCSFHQLASNLDLAVLPTASPIKTGIKLLQIVAYTSGILSCVLDQLWCLCEGGGSLKAFCL
jgi:hypothetical protein